MDNKTKNFYMKLKEGPTFLMLGQNYLSLHSNKDSFLKKVLDKYGNINEIKHEGYSKLFDTDVKEDYEASLAWMSDFSKRLSEPQWLEVVGQYPWNGVYTTAIDSIWQRPFKTDWRDLQNIFSADFKPNNPRDKIKLNCTFLYGNINRVNNKEIPPLSKFDKRKRDQEAISIMRRLPEIITVLGTLVIEGYDGEIDWFNFDFLLPIIDELQSNQAHIFNIDKNELMKNSDVNYLVNNNKLILHEESLFSILMKGKEKGFISFGEKNIEKNFGRKLNIENDVLNIPKRVWNQVSNSAIVVDDKILAPVVPKSKEKEYIDFKRFLAESSTTPNWDGYKRGFAFKRDCEKKMFNQICNKLKSKELQNESIILHGQSGTGKTVSLGSIAYTVRRELKNPVLFIERKSQKIDYFDIDYFCRWAEDNNAGTVIIIWDGMVKYSNYQDLLNFLSSRGRKVILVGSCYKLNNNFDDDKNIIEASSEFSKDEINRFKKFINKFDISYDKYIKSFVESNDKTFLVALYRFLPSSRAELRSGIVREVRNAKKKVKKRIESGELNPEFNSALGQALIQKGIVDKNEFLATNKKMDGIGKDVLRELINLVMIPGLFGLKVPFDLLLRSLGKDIVDNFHELFKDIDIFRWEEDSRSNLIVTARHSLEAKFISDTMIGGPKYEVKYIKKLLINVREHFKSNEVRFAINLVRNMVPNKEYDSNQIDFHIHPNRYSQYLKDISEILTELREKYSIETPHLMVQEARLLRKYVQYNEEDSINQEQLLDKSIFILNNSIELVNEKENQDLTVMLVELGTVLNTKAEYMLKQSNPEKAFAIFKKARDCLLKASNLSPESYYPVDVLAWGSRNILDSDLIDSKQKAEIEVDINHIFTMAESENPELATLEKYQRRKYEIGRALENHELSKEAFEMLKKQGSGAGFYLKVMQMINEKEVPYNERKKLTTTERKICEKGFNYLESNMEYIKNDGRCIYLLFKLWWLHKTGKPLFFKERQTVPFSKNDWQYVLSLINKLNVIQDFKINPSIKYINGLANFHIEDFDKSMKIFKEIDREGLVHGKRRIVKKYLASDFKGYPIEYDGTVVWTGENQRKGELFVEKIHKQIFFNPLDFNKPDIKKGETLNSFHIGFNFIGPVATPISYYQKDKKENGGSENE